MSQIDEIALRQKVRAILKHHGIGPDGVIEADLLAAFAELSKRAEPVGFVAYGDRVEWYTKPLPETDLFTVPPIHDIAKPVGLTELLEEVQKADAALSRGDTNEALIRVRTAWVAASALKLHVNNRNMQTVEDIENRVAEACANLTYETLDDTFLSGHGYATNLSEAIRSGEWRKYK